MIKPHCCPICDKPCTATAGPAASGAVAAESAQSNFPFCSDRCRQIDLLRWCNGSYAVVEDVHPEVIEFLRHDPDILVQGEGVEDNRT
ncbi:MAG: DNA gyrase inhibitor YacG [Planctomycetaceae bacterium]